jgi:hypothetical protein
MGGNFAYVNTATVATSATEEQDQTAGTNMFYVSRGMAPIYPVYKRDENGNFIWNSHNRIVYDYGDEAGHQRPTLGNANALAVKVWMIKIYQGLLCGNMYTEISFLKISNLHFVQELRMTILAEWCSKW